MELINYTLKSRRKAYLSGTIAVNIQKMVMALLAIVITPYILIRLGNEQYGVWLLISNILGYLNLVDGGVSGTSTALIARTSGINERKENDISEIFSSVFFLQLIIGCVFLLVGITFSFFFTDIFHFQQEIKYSPSIIFILTTISFFFTFLFRPFTGLMVGNQQIAFNSSIELGAYILNVLLIVLFLKFNFQLLALPISGILSKLATLPIYILFLRKKFSDVTLSFRNVSFKCIKSIYKISSWWFIGVLSAMIIYSSDNILIGKFLGSAAITSYALTFQLANFLKERIYSFNNVAMPGISQLFGSNNYKKIRDLYLSTQKLVLIIASMAFSAVALFNIDLMRIWVGEKFYLGFNLNILFATSLFLTIIFHSSSILVSASLDVRNLSLFRLFEALLNISLSIILIQQIGYIGLVFSTVLASFFTNFWYAPYKIMKILKISLFEYFYKVLKPLIIPMLQLIILPIILHLINWDNKFYIKVLLFSIVASSIIYRLYKKNAFFFLLKHES